MTAKKSRQPATQGSGAVLGRLLHDVARLRRRAFNILSAPAGLTRTQYWLLSFIAQSGDSGLTQSQIAARLDIGKVTVGSTIDRLAAHDLVRRGSDGADRRIKPIILTLKGRKALESMQEVRPVIDEVVFRGISPRAQQELIENLGHVRANLLSMLKEHQARPRSKPARKKIARTPTRRDIMFTSFG